MKLKKVLFILVVSILLLTSCNSQEDVAHMNQDKMTKYVTDAIDEPVTFDSVVGNPEDPVMTYVYKLEDRDITFEATSVITALGVDGTRFGNYDEEIYIYYEEGIVKSDYYSTERLRIRNALEIDEEDENFVLSIINANNYEDINKLAQYAVELDMLYDFKEIKPERLVAINLGVLSFSNPGNSIEGPRFSTNEKKQLIYEDVYNEMVASYIAQLIQFDQTDEKIPEDVWKRYAK